LFLRAAGYRILSYQQNQGANHSLPQEHRSYHEIEMLVTEIGFLCMKLIMQQAFAPPHFVAQA
jgi:hypothetical protein